MKNLLLAFVVVAFAACTTSNSSNGPAEMEAVKAAIEQETNAFYKVDRAAWESSWVQANHAYWSYSDSTGTSYIEGWENIAKNFESYFKTQVANRNIDVAKPATELVIERANWEIRLYDGGAYARYTQKVKDNQIDRDETSQIRVMEKKDGVWKVAYVGIIAKYE
jgi:hypothetical protein